MLIYYVTGGGTSSPAKDRVVVGFIYYLAWVCTDQVKIYGHPSSLGTPLGPPCGAPTESLERRSSVPPLPTSVLAITPVATTLSPSSLSASNCQPPWYLKCQRCCLLQSLCSISESSHTMQLRPGTQFLVWVLEQEPSHVGTHELLGPQGSAT